MKTIRTTALFTFSLLLSISVLAAGKPAKLDPVNANYPAWSGITAKNYVRGREITPSDLRHKITTVVLFQMEKSKEQLPSVAGLSQGGPSFGENGIMTELLDWSTAQINRDRMVIFVNVGETSKKAVELMDETVKTKDEKQRAKFMAFLQPNGVPIYNGVTFEGAPDPEGKYPYVYVLGHEGKEPLFKGQYDAKSAKDYKAAVNKAKALMSGEGMMPWKQFTGFAVDPQFTPGKNLLKTIAKGKPVAADQKVLLKKVTSSNADEAKECQILYDALEQTRSDLVFRINQEAVHSPHRAMYDVSVLCKYWPQAKKQVADLVARITKNPSIASMAAMYVKMQAWADPAYQPKKSDVKKIKGDLAKFKKALAPLKESQNIQVQNAALTIDTEIDSLADTIESRAQ